MLLVADDPAFATCGGVSVLHPWHVCPLSVAFHTHCIPILWEFRLPHLAVCLLRGTRLSVVRGFLRPLYLNSLGVLLPILSTPLQRI